MSRYNAYGLAKNHGIMIIEVIKALTPVISVVITLAYGIVSITAYLSDMKKDGAIDHAAILQLVDNGNETRESIKQLNAKVDKAILLFKKNQ